MKFFLGALLVFLATHGAFGQIVSWEEFKKAVMSNNGNEEPRRDQYENFRNGIESLGGVTSKEEAAMALTQYIHETDGMRAMREYLCVNTGCPGRYETPSCDIKPQRYYGRGYIQLTSCPNYRDASRDIFGNADILRNDPDRVAREQDLAWKTAFWFWKTKVHNAPGVSQGQFGATTKAINGGLECGGGINVPTARLRFQKYGRVRQALNLPGAGDEGGCYN